MLQNINGRLQTAAKRNPTLDVGNYQAVTGKLEYADIRELQDIIVNKKLWGLFEGMLGSKETLNTRFQQFAELRNTTRHSRTVDEITRKEGEVALLWFEQVLERSSVAG